MMEQLDFSRLIAGDSSTGQKGDNVAPEMSLQNESGAGTAADGVT